jgi:hypothetical protein
MKSITVTTDHKYSFKKHTDELSDDLKIYSDIFKITPFTWLVDRTELTNLPFHTHLNETYKLDSNYNSFFDLNDVCQREVEKYKNVSGKIYILWSGGIDSMLLTISFLKSDIPKDKIVIACNFDSVKEYYSFYVNHILPNFEVVSVDKFVSEANTTSFEGILLTGDPCDVLFGNDLAVDMCKSFAFDYLTMPCSRQNVVSYLEHKKFSIQSANCWYDYFMFSTNKSPKEITTMQDFSWWEGFNHRWQAANDKIKIRFSAENAQKCIQFFNSKEFQCWSVNRPRHTVKSMNDFKLESKKIILDYTKDQQYFDNKIKLNSNSYVFGLNSCSAILNNGQRLTSKEFNIFDFYNNNNFINDWLSI